MGSCNKHPVSRSLECGPNYPSMCNKFYRLTNTAQASATTGGVDNPENTEATVVKAIYRMSVTDNLVGAGDSRKRESYIVQYPGCPDAPDSKYRIAGSLFLFDLD